LKRLRAHHVHENITYTRHTVDTGLFMDRLFQQDKHIRREFSYKPTMLYIGAEDYEKLMCSEEIRQIIDFTGHYSFGSHLGTEIIGLKVKVIPWMKGMLAL
jgi:predicted homoserine dehydrogenase-like protein